MTDFRTGTRKDGTKYRHPVGGKSGQRLVYSPEMEMVKVPKPVKPISETPSLVRKAVELRYGEAYFPIEGKRLPRVYSTENNIHVRLKMAGYFDEFRTQDVGREHFTLRRAGKKKGGTWETQSWIFDKKDLATNKDTQNLFVNILKREGVKV